MRPFASPMLLGATEVKPFALSGTFAGGFEGWSVTAGTGSILNTAARTAPNILYLDPSSDVSFLLPASLAKKQTISVSIWHRGGGAGSSARALYYRIGTAAEVVLASINSSLTSYAQFSGSFANPGSDPVTIRVSGGGRALYLDDWSISGVPL